MAQTFGACYCGDPLTLDHECYHWPPQEEADEAEASIRLPLPFVRALWQDRQAQAAQLADIWLLVDLWDQGTEGGLDTLERLVALRETGHVD